MDRMQQQAEAIRERLVEPAKRAAGRAADTAAGLADMATDRANDLLGRLRRDPVRTAAPIVLVALGLVVAVAAVRSMARRR